MTQQLDLPDIQGNIIRAYGRFGFPKARFFFLKINDGDRGREFVGTITKRVTTSVSWGPPPKGVIPKPKAPINIAFTYNGLKALGLPRGSLAGFPEEFAMGMKARKDILGDDGPSAPEYWDKVWEKHEDVHVAIAINAQTPEEKEQPPLKYVEEAYQWVKAQIDDSHGGVVLLTGHRGDEGQDDLPFQDASLLYDKSGNIMAKEHFGYTDGIGDPVFEGQITEEYRVVGRGKLTREGGWARLETGEFLLGHPDEAHEYPPAPPPTLLSRNGTFMVYRKLHQNVASFERLLDAHAESFSGSTGNCSRPSSPDAGGTTAHRSPIRRMPRARPNGTNYSTPRSPPRTSGQWTRCSRIFVSTSWDTNVPSARTSGASTRAALWSLARTALIIRRARWTIGAVYCAGAYPTVWCGIPAATTTITASSLWR